MPTTTIKVPVELRDRLAFLANRDHTTLAGAIARSLDAAEDAFFWDDLAASLDGVQSRRGTADDLGGLNGSLTDGLDPNEDWNDVR